MPRARHPLARPSLAQVVETVSIVHTYPVGDLIEHDTDGGDCICGPTTEAVMREDGSNGWQVIHHSLDGREVSE